MLWKKKIYFNISLQKIIKYILTDKLLKKNARYVLISLGLTWFIQPLDVSINGPFKKFLHHWDSDYRINHLNSKKPDCYEIIDAIVRLWYDDTKITVDIIKNSFKITGISINLDGTENHLVKKNDEVSEEIIVPEEFIEDNEEEKIENDDKKEKLNKEISELPKITEYFKKDESNYIDIDE